MHGWVQRVQQGRASLVPPSERLPDEGFITYIRAVLNPLTQLQRRSGSSSSASGSSGPDTAAEPEIILEYDH